METEKKRRFKDYNLAVEAIRANMKWGDLEHIEILNLIGELEQPFLKMTQADRDWKRGRVLLYANSLL